MDVVLYCHDDRAAVALADFKKDARPDCGGHGVPLKVPEPTENAHATPIVPRNENVALRVIDVHDPARDFSLWIVPIFLFGIRLVPSAQALRPLDAQFSAVDFGFEFDGNAVAWLDAGVLQHGRVDEHRFAGRIVKLNKSERSRVIPAG
ncbi:hypothetical protein BjapCC829_23090 [Bradyrhizobium barranii]|uniref:Uncharacterized protein n=1 Tax=Bradyrhizobium barranii TaxID=2992140 RepID=A0ABY3QAG3_9BRAD|nr:hypothetical protein [Bradyrhizobium japonicum]UFW82877.1 hypothetical protein BjapCC829_23090 [Bradyrhizobium japonicum]